jgi:hypothetical protein
VGDDDGLDSWSTVRLDTGMVHKFRLVFVLAFLFSSTSQAAVLNEWGTIAATGSYACLNPTCNIVDAIYSQSINGTGGAGTSNAAHELDAADPNGSARAQANVIGGLQIPELKAEAFSNAGGGTSALAVGVQAYTYTGGSGTLTLSLSLTGAILDNTPAPPPLTPAEESLLILAGVDPDPAGIPDLTRIEVLGALFAPSSGFSLTDLTFGGLVPLAALNALDAYTQIDSVEIVEDLTNPNIVNAGHLLSISGLNVGDSFYLFTALAASADGAGQYADAFSTLSVSFTAGGDEVVLASSVPIPAAAWLLGPALFAFVGRRRRIGIQRAH